MENWTDTRTFEFIERNLREKEGLREGHFAQLGNPLNALIRSPSSTSLQTWQALSIICFQDLF